MHTKTHASSGGLAARTLLGALCATAMMATTTGASATADLVDVSGTWTCEGDEGVLTATVTASGGAVEDLAVSSPGGIPFRGATVGNGGDAELRFEPGVVSWLPAQQPVVVTDHAGAVVGQTVVATSSCNDMERPGQAPPLTAAWACDGAPASIEVEVGADVDIHSETSTVSVVGTLADADIDANGRAVVALGTAFAESPGDPVHVVLYDVEGWPAAMTTVTPAPCGAGEPTPDETSSDVVYPPDDGDSDTTSPVAAGTMPAALAAGLAALAAGGVLVVRARQRS